MQMQYPVRPADDRSSKPKCNVGDFYLFDKIGEGKFGKVYKACKHAHYNEAVRDYLSRNHGDTELRHFKIVDFLSPCDIYACKRLKLAFKSAEEEK